MGLIDEEKIESKIEELSPKQTQELSNTLKLGVSKRLTINEAYSKILTDLKSGISGTYFINSATINSFPYPSSTISKNREEVIEKMGPIFFKAPSTHPTIGIPRPKRTTFDEFYKNIETKTFPVEFDNVLTPFTTQHHKLKSEIEKGKPMFIDEYNIMFNNPSLSLIERRQIKQKVKDTCNTKEIPFTSLRELSTRSINNIHEFKELKYETELYFNYLEKPLKKYYPEILNTLKNSIKRNNDFDLTKDYILSVIVEGINKGFLEFVTIDTE